MTMWGDMEILAKMPVWYFDRKQIKNSPSFLVGIDTNTENRYRREGARFIIDAGTKMGLRWDTCATGVVYFHRFYMFHSFKEFYRYVTAACCLFLAGKVEETPKKCKDVIKIAQNLLSSASFAKFGDDPREEVMTMERILLKTIKFDFNVEHPYSRLLKYAKLFKCEKEKIQNMAQMAWTFINDSLCTTLCLQWEPEITCVSLMYLASRLTKFEPSDWSGRTSSKSKWWEDWIEGMSMELMEDICHQVLDLYSNKNKKHLNADSPPNSPAKGMKAAAAAAAADDTPPPPPDRPPPTKRPREEIKSEADLGPKSEIKEKEAKFSSSKHEAESNSTASNVDDNGATAGAPIPVAQHRTPSSRSNNNNNSSSNSDSYSSYNPYVSSRMFTSSFMSQEGSQNIQSILAGTSAPPSSASSVPPSSAYSDPIPPSHHGPPDTSQYPPPSASVPPPSHTSQYPPYHPPPPQQSQYAPPSIPPPHSYPPPTSTNPPQTAYDPYNPPVSNQSYLPPSSYNAPPPATISSSYLPPPTHPPSNSYNYPPAHLPPPSHPSLHPQQQQQRPPPTSYHPPPSHPSHPYGAPSRPSDQQHPPQHQSYGGVSRNYSSMPGGSGVAAGGSNNTRNDNIPALTEVKITGRPDWNMKQ